MPYAAAKLEWKLYRLIFLYTSQKKKYKKYNILGYHEDKVLTCHSLW